jgi:Flp pilus assembly protein TadD
MRRLRSLAFVVALTASATCSAPAQDLRITLPKRSHPTPVQQLNLDGVKAVQKHQYDKAKKLFYKAYLLDPNDPFTLNNLGYISELDGELDRAQRYYGLAADVSSDATVKKASSESVEGKSVAEVAGNAGTKGMEINRLNIQAMSLLSHDRTQEAEVVLGKALLLDIHDPFTLNNIGYMREQEGELESALSYYSASAARRSPEAIVVALKSDWRGKPISEIADRNAKNVRRVMERQLDDPATRVARLNLRGVAALNRNNVRDAREYFKQAYKVDPTNAFTLNNMGYIAELDGDKETAEFYYAKAREGDRADRKVTVSTRGDLVGQPMRNVAEFGDNKVDARLQQIAEARRREGGMVSLKRRDGSVVVEPPMPPPKAPQQELPASDQPPAGEVMQPLPDNQQPPSAQPAAPATQPPAQGQPGDVMPPLPDNQQPANAKPGNQQPPAQGQPGDVIPPLPDNQQPGAARQPNSQSPTQGQPGDVIPPLPDNQQPPSAQGQQPPNQQKPPQ